MGLLFFSASCKIVMSDAVLMERHNCPGTRDVLTNFRSTPKDTKLVGGMWRKGMSSMKILLSEFEVSSNVEVSSRKSKYGTAITERKESDQQQKVIYDRLLGSSTILDLINFYLLMTPTLYNVMMSPKGPFQ